MIRVERFTRVFPWRKEATQKVNLGLGLEPQQLREFGLQATCYTFEALARQGGHTCQIGITVNRPGTIEACFLSIGIHVLPNDSKTDGRFADAAAIIDSVPLVLGTSNVVECSFNARGRERGGQIILPPGLFVDRESGVAKTNPGIANLVEKLGLGFAVLERFIAHFPDIPADVVQQIQVPEGVRVVIYWH